MTPKPQANKTIDDKQKFVDAMHNYFGLQDLNDLEYWGDVYDSVVQALVTEVRANERQAMLGAVGKDIELRGDIDDDLRKFVPDIDKLSIEAYGKIIH